MGETAMGEALGEAAEGAAAVLAVLGVISNELYCAGHGLCREDKAIFAGPRAAAPHPLN
jgi:hypothetical protein